MKKLLVGAVAATALILVGCEDRAVAPADQGLEGTGGSGTYQQQETGTMGGAGDEGQMQEQVGEPMRDTDIYQEPAAQEPLMQDPAMQDPAMQDPAMQDRGMQDPMMQEDRGMQQNPDTMEHEGSLGGSDQEGMMQEEQMMEERQRVEPVE